MQTGFQVYEGREPYVFISYSHKNEEVCRGLMVLMQSRSLRFWYDFEGIHGGAHWRDVLAERIDGAACVAALISQDYLESNNCRDEIEFALDNGKNIIQIFIEDIELAGGLAMSLNRRHRLYRNKYPSDEEFMNALMRSEGVEACVEKAAPPSKPREKSISELLKAFKSRAEEFKAAAQRYEKSLVMLIEEDGRDFDGKLSQASSDRDGLYEVGARYADAADELKVALEKSRESKGREKAWAEMIEEKKACDAAEDRTIIALERVMVNDETRAALEMLEKRLRRGDRIPGMTEQEAVVVDRIADGLRDGVESLWLLKSECNKEERELLEAAAIRAVRQLEKQRAESKRALEIIEKHLRDGRLPWDATYEESRACYNASNALREKSMTEVWKDLSAEDRKTVWAAICREEERRKKMEEREQVWNLEKLKRYVRREQKRLERGEAILPLPSDAERQAAEKLRQVLYMLHAEAGASAEDALNRLTAEERIILLTVADRDVRAFKESSRYIERDRLKELLNKAVARYKRRGDTPLRILRLQVQSELNDASGPLAAGKRKKLQEMIDAIDQVLDYGV